nr:unnamed protein product [Naegleria fowleri]
MIHNTGDEDFIMSDGCLDRMTFNENRYSSTMSDDVIQNICTDSFSSSPIKRKRDHHHDADYLIPNHENSRKTKHQVCPNYPSSPISREESQQKRQIVELILSKKRFDSKRKLPPQHELYHTLFRDVHLIGELEVQNRMICKLDLLLLKLDEKNIGTIMDGQQLMTIKQLVDHIATITSNVSLKEIAEKVLVKLSK